MREKIIKKKKNFLSDQILTINNYDFCIYGFIFKRRTQRKWFVPPIISKEIDWGLIFF
jgi:hypothetical protein